MVSEQVDWATQRELIRTLVKQVEIEQGQVNIVFRVGPNPSTPDPGKDFLQHCKGPDFAITCEYSPSRYGKSDKTSLPKKDGLQRWEIRRNNHRRPPYPIRR